VPQVALSYVLAQPLEVFALVGCNTAEEFRANVEAGAAVLTPEEIAWLENGNTPLEERRSSA
jgi:aryl-alcohol dehydrogenase-like predicted oxidoreductase